MKKAVLTFFIALTLLTTSTKQYANPGGSAWAALVGFGQGTVFGIAEEITQEMGLNDGLLFLVKIIGLNIIGSAQLRASSHLVSAESFCLANRAMYLTAVYRILKSYDKIPEKWQASTLLAKIQGSAIGLKKRVIG